MPTLAGIHNENEFYSHHYLAEIFAGDIQATLERWRERAESANARTPWAELRALAPEHLRFRRDFERERRAGQRILRQREWFRLLLTRWAMPASPPTSRWRTARKCRSSAPMAGGRRPAPARPRRPKLKFVDDLAGQHRFHHWELAFADVFAANGGFDLVLGNPPWVKVEWEEGGVRPSTPTSL